ncbi:MAG: cyclic nucleotide-binding domain-containing protein [Candidatus Anammoxibacter sp.]
METVKRTIHNPTTTNSNFIIVKDNDIGEMMFGCPPELVKFFNKENVKVPNIIVIPRRTFRKGINYCDLEFIVYSIIFLKKVKGPLDVICTEFQEGRIRTVLKESLFGPVVKEMFHSFMYWPLNKLTLNKEQKKSLKKIIEQVVNNKALSLRFEELIVKGYEEDKIIACMTRSFCKYLDNINWLKKFSKKGIYRIITTAYVNAAMLKREIDVFSVCKEEESDEFIDSVICFRHFDRNGKVTFNGDINRKFKIWQTNKGSFKLYKNRKLIDAFELTLEGENRELMQTAESPLEIPELGITFLGSGTGFDPDTYTSCFIIWINGKAIAVDLLASCNERFRQLGIASNDITHVFLSHLHADHDTGILEKMMLGEKIHLLSSRLIFDSFLRKAEGLTKFSKENLEDFVYFTNLEKGKEVSIPDIDNAYITFDYGFHSIPSGRFKLRYKQSNGKDIRIGFSGDTKYKKKKVDKLCKERIITSGRRDSIMGFLWDCDVIIHEAGGGVLHTDLDDLNKLPARLKKKCILTHTSKNDRKPGSFVFAEDGQTFTIINKKYEPSVNDLIQLLKNTGVFPNFANKNFRDLIQASDVETYSKGQYIFKQASTGHKFYVILSGFVEIIKDNKVSSTYEKGHFLGELALINQDQKRRASARAKSKVQLMGISRELYKKYRLSTSVQEPLYDLSNYFSDSILSHIVGYISRGEVKNYKKGEDIIKQVDTSRDVYVLIVGEVDVLDLTDKLITHVSNVEIFGEIAMIKHAPRCATVRVTSMQATAIRLKGRLVSEISKRFPSFYGTILKKMDQRLEANQKIIRV